MLDGLPLVQLRFADGQPAPVMSFDRLISEEQQRQDQESANGSSTQRSSSSANAMAVPDDLEQLPASTEAPEHDGNVSADAEPASVEAQVTDATSADVVEDATPAVEDATHAAPEAAPEPLSQESDPVDEPVAEPAELESAATTEPNEVVTADSTQSAEADVAVEPENTNGDEADTTVVNETETVEKSVNGGGEADVDESPLSTEVAQE